MKPRLPRALLTYEDAKIWETDWYHSLASPWRIALWIASRDSDRRDADLMFEAQNAPSARFISMPVGEHWGVSMIAFASLVYRWRLVRCKRDEFYPNKPDITNCL